MMTLFHLALAIILFYLLNWLGRHVTEYVALSVFARGDDAPAFNFLLRVAAPTVFIILIGTALYASGHDRLVRNLHLVVLYYVLFRLAYNIVLERARLLNWPLELIRGALTLLLALAAYKYILISRRNTLPDFSTIANELWLLIAVFLYEALNRIRLTDRGTRARKASYLDAAFGRYDARVGSGKFCRWFPEIIAGDAVGVRGSVSCCRWRVR